MITKGLGRHPTRTIVEVPMKAILTILLLLAPLAYADTATDIEQAILNNLAHTQNEDIAATMSDIHTQSPAYLATQQTLQQLFPAYELKYELLNYEFVGEDDEYAYAKVKQITKKVSGPAFQDNELEILMVFKRENGSWKLWTQANLSYRYL